MGFDQKSQGAGLIGGASTCTTIVARDHGLVLATDTLGQRSVKENARCFVYVAIAARVPAGFAQSVQRLDLLHAMRVGVSVHVSHLSSNHCPPPGLKAPFAPR